MTKSVFRLLNKVYNNKHNAVYDLKLRNLAWPEVNLFFISLPVRNNSLTVMLEKSNKLALSGIVKIW